MPCGAGARHRCAIVALEPLAGAFERGRIRATVAMMSINRCALRELIHTLRSVLLRKWRTSRPSEWRDGRTWDAQPDPEGSERRDSRSSCELFGSLSMACRELPAFAVLPQDLAFDEW